MISEDAYYFLQEFFKEHPEYSENPLNIVGESYGGHYAPAVAHKENDYNEEMISEDAYYFLQEFFKEHPEYSENPLNIVGESYGGHYAPAVAHK
ncbi:Serine carboxypeptidase 3 (Serine carboxypeptidase III), partial [Durusdinium trenchii]